MSCHIFVLKILLQTYSTKNHPVYIKMTEKNPTQFLNPRFSVAVSLSRTNESIFYSEVL